jgi:hypothetical protein
VLNSFSHATFVSRLWEEMDRYIGRHDLSSTSNKENPTAYCIEFIEQCAEKDLISQQLKLETIEKIHFAATKTKQQNLTNSQGITRERLRPRRARRRL